MKKSNDTSWDRTSDLVAQHLNHCATAVPVIPNTGSYSTYSTAPRSAALVEKLTAPQLIKKFPAFYRTQVFITGVDDSHF